MPARKVTAAAFAATLSTAGRTEPAPYYSRGAWLRDARPAIGQTTTVDRWDGSRFVEVELTWDGDEYAEVEPCDCGRAPRVGTLFCSDACEKAYQEM